MTIALTRRAFVRAGLSAAGGLAVAACLPGFAAAAEISAEPWSSDAGAGDEVGAFVAIDPDNSITLRVAKSEMGQGVLTSLAMILAEELACDLSRVQVEYASAHRNLVENDVYQSMGTGGSSSVRRSRAFLQQAGASARERLIAAAAARWGVKPSACAAKGAVVRHEASGRSASYGELAADAAKIALAVEPAIKTPEHFELIGLPHEAVRHAAESHRRRAVRDRRAPARHGLRRRRQLPRFRRRPQVLRLLRHLEPTRDHRRRAGDERRGGRRRQFLARQGGARRDAARMGVRRLRPPPTARSSAPNIARRSTGRSPTAAAMATSAPLSLRPRDASRRSTRFPISRMRRWSL